MKRKLANILKLCLFALACCAGLAVWFLHGVPKLIAVGTALVLMLGGLAVNLLLNRCPHCGAALPVDSRCKTCPRCGKAL